MKQESFDNLEILLCKLLIFGIVSMFWLFFISRIMLYNLQTYFEYKLKMKESLSLNYNMSDCNSIV